MKINEKSLIHYANSKSISDKEGYLLKKGEVNKSFQRSWFVLKGNLLFYYYKKNDKEPVGVVVLEGCTIELAAAHHINNGSANNGSSGAAMSTESFTFEIVFPRSGARTYVLSAASQEEMESWMKALTCASYDYLKMMVTELQRQLEEANHNQKLDQSWESTHLHTHTIASSDYSSPISSSPTGSDTPLRKTNLFASCSSDCSANRLDSGCEVLTSSKESCDSELASNMVPMRRPCRVNPFNSLDSDGEYSSPLSPDEAMKLHSYSNDSLHGKILDFTEAKISQTPGKPRNFLQMHEEFGRLYKSIPTAKDLN